jgi:hypothetical protein
MTVTNHYKSNLRDVLFNLFEVLDIGSTTLGKAPFATFDAEAARDALKALEEFAREEWSKSFAEGRETGSSSASTARATSRCRRA